MNIATGFGQIQGPLGRGAGTELTKHGTSNCRIHGL